MASPIASVWKIAIFNGVTIDLFTSGWEPDFANIISELVPYGATAGTLYFFASDSEVVSLSGTLYGTANLNTLDTAVKSFIPVTVTSDAGAEGVFQIMELGALRGQALNYPSRQYMLTLKLRRI